MVVDFSNINMQEKPTLILKNASDVPIGTLGAAYNVSADIKYNETSSLEFTIPAHFDGVETPCYNAVIGMRIIDLQGVGQFILMNPKEAGDGIKCVKSCKAYSLEYEFTFKKITLQNGTYNFWNPAAPSGTILGMILELMPSWSPGEIDSALVGKYRTYEVNEENLYNFIKNTLQTSYNCIFDFDTYNRTINVRDVSSYVPTNPIYLSYTNLAKSIEVEEDTESIITRLDVNGAEGVDIRDVNPSGTNKIINLDYFATAENFGSALKAKYEQWKALYHSYQLQYYNLSVEYSIQVMRKATESAALTELEGELTGLENQQAVIIEAIHQNLETQSALTEINSEIKSKQSEIDSQKKLIESIGSEMESILSDMKVINNTTNFQDYFSEDEYRLLDRYIKDDAISESSFVAQSTLSYDNKDISNKIENLYVYVRDSEITAIPISGNGADKTIYDIKGGTIAIGSRVSGTIINCIFEHKSSNEFVMTAYLDAVSSNGEQYKSACVSLTGNVSTLNSGSENLTVCVSSGFLYLTQNTSEYEKRSVAWDLYEYGNEILEKISQPSYRFSITSANFISLEEFEVFKNSLHCGEKLYVGLSDDATLSPIFIGCRIDYDNLTSLSLEFSDTYVSGDSAFQLADLLDQSVSMGKNVDLSKFTYSAFVDSGANTQVKEFMTSALDVAKNAIMSSNNQAISWGDSGIRLRKWSNEAHTSYEPHQIWMNNNSILMTKDNWSTAELAIGHFYDKNLGNIWGIVAPNIVGTLLAGSNLVIESAKKDGSVAVFKVDADGCAIHNSNISMTSASKNTHILLDPDHGMIIGDYPLIDNGAIDEDKYKFWVDDKGNLFFKGTLKATTGEFTGKITATEGYIGGAEGWTIKNTYIYNGKPAFNNTTKGVYIGTDGIAIGNYKNYIKASNSGEFTANNANITGSITTGDLYADGGTIGGWTITGHKIYAGDGNAILTAVMQAPSSSAMWVFAAGGASHSSYSDCPFRVDKNGNLYATSATIEGSVTATSGKIGGCSISNGVLKIKDANISGTISADHINGAGLSVINGSFSGTLNGATGSFSGSLNAATGTFGTSYYPFNIGTGSDSHTSPCIYSRGSSFAGIGGLGIVADNYVYLGGDGFSYWGGHADSFDYNTAIRPGIVYCSGDNNAQQIKNMAIAYTNRGIIFCYGGTTNLRTANNAFSYEIASMEVRSTDIYMQGTFTGSSSNSIVSDRNKKHSISVLDDRYDILFDNLAPVIYKYNDGRSGRLHSGFIAQDVLQAINNAKLSTLDFAAYIEAQDLDDCTVCGLRYEEFIALNTWQIQKLKAEIKTMRSEIERLTNQTEVIND